MRRYAMDAGETNPYSRCLGRSLCWVPYRIQRVNAMKKTLLLIAGVAALLSGCIVVPDGGYYDGGYHHHHRHWD